MKLSTTMLAAALAFAFCGLAAKAEAAILPDLTVAALSNQNNTVNVTFRNLSGSQSAATTARLDIRSTDDNEIVEIRRVNVRGLPPTKSHTLRIQTGKPLNRVRITVYVDPSNVVQESNEGNNFQSIKVGNTIRNAGDLVVSSMNIDAARKTVSVTVRNADLGSIRRGSTLRLESAFRLNPKERLSKSIGTLPAGGRTTLTFQVREAFQGMQFTATADAGNAVLETNEQNNSLTKSIR